MQIDFVHSGFFKLDGGAMFGIVPKVMWEKKNAPDENNLCQWAARCLLIRDKGRVILVDTGLGNKQDEKFRSHFHPHGEQSLLTSLAQHGVEPEDVTDVLLTHLHFDHVGGATRFNEAGEIVTTFPNATYWSNDAHWSSAMHPNAKEAASFLIENLAPLKASGQLDMLPIQPGKDFNWLPNITLRPLYGHTEAMMMPMIDLGNGKRFAYCADLIPSSAHVRAPWIIAYDIRPLLTLEEKARFVEEAAVDGYTVGFEHDPIVGSARLVKNKKGRITIEAISI